MIFYIDKTIRRKGVISSNDAAAMRLFGITKERLEEKVCEVKCKIEINKGDIVYITGPSGAGKSVLLRELEKNTPEQKQINLNRINLAEDYSVIDCITGYTGDIIEGLKLLSIAGLGEAFCVLNKPTNLSEGQQYRYRLAMSIALGAEFIFADEFCNGLDRITAAVISFNIHKYTKRKGVTFILASCHEDILADLKPDVIVERTLSGQTNVIYPTLKNSKKGKKK
ncbi:MAG: ATP-binding cassette domain-containing protein [Sedimentisphaerales bacterium]|nr:ATP-binding cassette domain-containing protein [Sedimentisphaerales bacterium]